MPPRALPMSQRREFAKATPRLHLVSPGANMQPGGCTMSSSSTDRIERRILLRAPRSRVWRALSDSAEFGTWFGVKVEGTFAPGARVRGAITHPGYEHVVFDITIERMEPERLVSYRWHHHAAPPGGDDASHA